MGGRILLVAAAIGAAAVFACAGGAGAAPRPPEPLEVCFAPQGEAPSDAVAADCLDGVLPLGGPGLPAESQPVCGSLPLDRCPSWTAVYDDSDIDGRSDQFTADMQVSPDGSLTVTAAKDGDRRAAVAGQIQLRRQRR